ncbi:MAG: hypothetical protein C4321_09720, partial [Chloroflexota bacterium]
MKHWHRGVAAGGGSRANVTIDEVKQSPEVSKLIEYGKPRGVVTYDEINEALGR